MSKRFETIAFTLMRFLQFDDSKSWSKNLVPPGLEPGTFRVLSERDNHYTMELYKLEKKSELLSR